MIEPVETTGAQKLIIAMLCDQGKMLQRLLGEDTIAHNFDYDLIYQGVTDGQSWMLRWKYGHVFNDGGTGEADPETVQQVARNFTMWSFIERSVANWTPEQTADFESRVERHETTPRYDGYDGNAEDEYGIASRMVEDVGRFQEFENRDHNAHMPTAERYRRMERAWREVWERMGHNTRDMTPEEVANVIIAGRRL